MANGQPTPSPNQLRHELGLCWLTSLSSRSTFALADGAETETKWDSSMGERQDMEVRLGRDRMRYLLCRTINARLCRYLELNGLVGEKRPHERYKSWYTTDPGHENQCMHQRSTTEIHHGPWSRWRKGLLAWPPEPDGTWIELVWGVPDAGRRRHCTAERSVLYVFGKRKCCTVWMGRSGLDGCIIERCLGTACF